MASVNVWFAIGNVTREPEVRTLPGGETLAQFTLAVSREFTTRAGGKTKETSFVDVDAWGQQGEIVAKYVHKGSQVHVQGRIKQDVWEDKVTKAKRSKLKCVLDAVQFLGGPDRGQPAGQARDDREDRTVREDSHPQQEKRPPPADDDDERNPFGG